MSAAEYDYRLLYDQHCLTEEGVQVLSSIYALSYMYAGALSTSTARVRLTCIYSGEGNTLAIHGGSIEKWRDGGWSVIDEFCDDREDFNEIEDLRQRLLYQTQSFLLGLPMEAVDANYNPSPSKPSKKPPTKKPFKAGKVADFKTKKSTEENKKDGKPSNSYKKDPKKDNPDFDFI